MSAPATGVLPVEGVSVAGGAEAVAILVEGVEVTMEALSAAIPVAAIETRPSVPVRLVCAGATGCADGAVAYGVAVLIESPAADVWVGRFVSFRCGERADGVLAVPGTVDGRLVSADEIPGVWR